MEEINKRPTTKVSFEIRYLNIEEASRCGHILRGAVRALKNIVETKTNEDFDEIDSGNRFNLIDVKHIEE